MEDNNTSAPVEPTLVVHGSITDYVGFKNKVNAEVRRLCAVRRAWATDEATQLLMFVTDEYYAQLDERPFDVGDLKEIFGRFANMNAVNNRLAEAKPALIDRQEKKGRKIAADLL